MSSMSSMTRNHNIQIFPANTLANGRVSFKNGNPVIRFEIGERDQYLLPHTMRLVGKFTVFKDAARALPVDATQCRMAENLGVYGAIDSLSFGTMRTKQTMEYIKNYNRFVSSYLQCVTSKEDGMTYLNNQALIMPGFEVQRQSVVNNPSGNKTKNSFSIPLISGIANGGNPLPLSSTWGIGGCEVTLNLSPDTNLLFTGNEDGDTSEITNAFYEFEDLSLVAETVEPSMEERQALMSQPASTYEFNTISTFYQTINSTNATINLNLGQSKVLSVFGNFVPVRYINSLVDNGLATLYPLNSSSNGSSLDSAQIEQVIFTRAGSRYPFHYNIDTLQKDDLDNRTADPQIVRNFINAVGSFAKGTKTQVSPLNNLVVRNKTEGTATALPNGSGLYYKDVPLGGMAVGIGCNYDSVSGNGVDFSNVPFGLQISSNLTTDNPNALYLFVHCKNTLVASQGSVQIMN